MDNAIQRTKDLKEWFDNLSFKEKVWCYNYWKEEYVERF